MDQFSFFCVALILSLRLATGAIPLRALVLVPFPDSNGTNGWDRGLELLPAARVAVREINDKTDLLAGYEMQLIERSHDACGVSIIFEGVSNLIRNALQTTVNDTNSIAVLGLACSTVAASVSPISGRDEVSLLQLAIANSHSLRDQSAYPHLWRFLSSSDGLVSSVIALMERFNWRRVGLIFDGSGFYFNAIANTFREQVESRNYTLLLDQGIDSTPGFVTAALDLVQTSGVRIIFAPTTIPESVEIMCQAAKRNLVWPGYVWIFPSRSLHEFYTNSDGCDNEDLLFKGIENVTLIDFELENRNSSAVLVSGRTYAEYKRDFDQESDKLQKEKKFVELLEHFGFTKDNPYSNYMYNQVWALAIALNQSLPDLQSRGYRLQDYQYNNSEITAIIEGHLEDVSFAGTLGTVAFDKHREVPTEVGIFQIRNDQEFEIATILNGTLTLLNISEEDIPSDNFERHYDLIGLGLVVIIYIQAALLSIFLTIMLFFMLIQQKQPEVKAMSPLLSVHIFIGCYLLVAASVILTTRQSTLIHDSTVYVTLCYLSDVFANTGINLITATVLIRLVRVYRIFTKITKIGFFWKNKPIFIIIVAIAFIPNILTIFEGIFEPKQYLEDQEYLLNQNPPETVINIRCFSKYANIFDTIIIVYTVILMLLLLAFAVLTRNVDRKHFKDTKKVTGFIFFFTLFGTIFITVSYILKSLGNENDAIVLQSYMHHIVILLSQLFLIAPKVIPTFYNKYNKNEDIANAKTTEDGTISSFFIQSPIIQKVKVFASTMNTEDGKTSEIVFF